MHSVCKAYALRHHVRGVRQAAGSRRGGSGIMDSTGVNRYMRDAQGQMRRRGRF